MAYGNINNLVWREKAQIGKLKGEIGIEKLRPVTKKALKVPLGSSSVSEMFS
jgi:hypothetical protein